MTVNVWWVVIVFAMFLLSVLGAAAERYSSDKVSKAAERVIGAQEAVLSKQAEVIASLDSDIADLKVELTNTRFQALDFLRENEELRRQLGGR